MKTNRHRRVSPLTDAIIGLVVSASAAALWAQQPSDTAASAARDTAVSQPAVPQQAPAPTEQQSQPAAAPPAPAVAPEPEGSREPAKKPGKSKQATSHSAPKPVMGETPPDSFAVRIPAGLLFGQFSKEDGPYLVEGSIVVPSGQTLEFGPGCRVYIGGKYSTITVFGQLIAKGTPEDPILFQSAKKNPNPWDWDRIYCRSKNRSEFEYCTIRHSNYGIFVENGLAGIDHCTFERNSLHGLVVKNSSVSVSKSTFRNGHVLALLCQPGAAVTADSIVIRDNITGLACDEKATLQFNGGEVTHNQTGIVFMENASATMVATSVERNRNGIVSVKEIPKRLREMVYNNSFDVKVMTPAQIAELLKPPEDVKSIVLPKGKTEVVLVKDFKSGFSALAAPKEATTSFIGNVSVGLKYFGPKSLVHPRQKGVVGLAPRDSATFDTTFGDTTIHQTRYLGEQSNKWYAGIQPETQLFMSGRKGMGDINLLADFNGNQWVGFRKNTFNLAMNYTDQSVVIGDFFENGTETSISGRQMTGLKYDGNFMGMGKGAKRLNLKLAAGETELPKDKGSHELDLYNTKVDSGMSVRQQLTYVAGVSVKPTLNSTVIVKGIIARDQTTNPFLRKALGDSAAPKPIEAQSGVIGGDITLLDGKLTVGLEVDLGSHDTLEKNEDVAWYNPEIPQSIGKVFKKISDTKYFAGTLTADATVKGYSLGATFSEIRPNFFAAGNPYLEADRRKATLKSEKQFRENLSANADYTFEESYVSNKYSTAGSGSSDPQFKNTLALTGKYTLGENKPEFQAEYTFDIRTRKAYANGDTIDSESGLVNMVDQQRVMKNLMGVEGKQRFANGIEYSLRYRLLLGSDLSDYSTEFQNELQPEGETQHTIDAKLSFKVLKLLRNKAGVRLAIKNKNRNNMDGLQYKIDDQAQITVIPRKLTVKVKGEYNSRADTEDATDTLSAVPRVTTKTKFYGGEGEVKYSMTSKLSLTGMFRYEKSYDENIGSAENYNVKIGGLSVTYLF